MTIDLGLLIGLISIGLGLFLGLFFGLAGFRKGVTSELSAIRETVIAIRETAEKTWDLVVTRFAPSSGTIVRELENLGKVRITAEPGATETTYLIEIEKPILREEFIIKKGKEHEFLEKEIELLGKEGKAYILSPTRMRYRLPSTDSKVCTEFVTFLLKWLNSTYVESLHEITTFEESILT
ncbi:hypothetical protein ES703_27745 [subsurface metagenome]